MHACAQAAQQTRPSCWPCRMQPMAAMLAVGPPGSAFSSSAVPSSVQLKSRAAAALAPIDANAHRVIETELIAEAEQSYLAVSPNSTAMCMHCHIAPFNVS